MISKKQINIYDILRLHILCCFTLISLSILVQISYFISSSIILSNYYDDSYISIFNLISLIIVILNICSYLVFYYYNTTKFRKTELTLLFMNLLAFISGIVVSIYYNQINPISIICIWGCLIHMTTFFVFLYVAIQ